MRLQIAGGLALYRKFSPAFKHILYPSANILILTGDCLRPDNPINKSFMDYLEDNWKQVFYIHGKSELGSPGAVIQDRPCATVKYSYRIKYSLPIYTIIGATYVKAGDTSWLKNEEQWINSTLNSSNAISILSSYSQIPDHLVIGNIAAVIQGDSEYNQFNPKNGPIVNIYKNNDGSIRKSYSPEFVLELNDESPKNVIGCWPSPSVA